MRTALTIAGSDSGGGAGIQADLKTFAAHGVYGTSAVTAITAQNTVEVAHVLPIPADIVVAQIDAVVSDLGADATKIGMLATAGVASAVAEALRRHKLSRVVLDTVMVAKGGARLLDDAAVAVVLEELLPLADLVTPNGPEAAALTGLDVTNVDEARRAASRLVEIGARAALVKGGHFEGPAVDVLFDGRTFTVLHEERIATRHTHGTGCTLSAAVAARLALGDSLVDAVRAAKVYVTRAIAAAPALGHGHGPLGHVVAPETSLYSLMSTNSPAGGARRRILPHLYVQVLIAIVAGGVFGYIDPARAVALKPLGDGFIALVKMLIGPVIFCTVVLGVAGAGDMKKVGRVGGKALFYFEIVSGFALVIGLIVVNLLRPGAGFNVDPQTLDANAVASYARAATEQTTVEFLLHIIPGTFFDAFTGSGNLLQVLLLALLFGYAMVHMGKAGETVHQFIEACSKIFFTMMNALMRLAPIGAGGAMAFTIGRYGVAALRPLLALIGSFYLTCVIFVVVVLGSIAAFAGFSIFRFLSYIRDELLIVLGTSSSEAGLLPLMLKLERLGCSKSVVGLVVPSGYSFNLDGTNIYLTMAALFVAQALNIELTWVQQITLLGVASFTGNGASGVTGAGFITLAATLAVVPSVPVAGLALILGIDRFMSEARAITNFIGNGVATIVISRWEGEPDHAQLARELAGPTRADERPV